MKTDDPQPAEAGLTGHGGQRSTSHVALGSDLVIPKYPGPKQNPSPPLKPLGSSPCALLPEM